ncbi:MAG: DUF6049 family protein, partial [Actinomycetota bacterium]|nr:DUF6049 family protein [Actinomycetota bacterium]
MTLPRGVRGRPWRRFGGRLALRLLFVALAVVLTVATPAAAASTPGYAGWSGAPSSAGDVAPALSPPAGIGTAAATDGSVLALTSISPAVAGPGVPVTVTGTVTAHQQALADASVRIVVGSTPIVSRASVAAWATSTGSLTGQEVGSTMLGAQVAPGASMPFTVTVPGGRLSLNRAFGVIPVAVQVRDTSSGATETLRTFVGWQRIKQYEPMRLAVVAPVTLSPDAALFDAQESSRTAAWQTELAPTGRINRILDGTDVTGPAGTVPVTWAVDPAVLRLAPGAGSDPLAPVVGPLVSRLQAAAGKHPLWALPYADPDLAATVAASPRDPTLGREIRDSTM